MPEFIRPRVFNGTRDLLPEEMIPRRKMLAVMTRIFERYGFAPVETPVMEYLDILLGKYGAENERLIYPLAYKGGEVLALRYDLTVPLSRLVAMHKDLPLPFKRYQIQPVYRADRPQPKQGRFREFYQCDVDTVGTESLVADAENVAVCYDVYEALGLTDERCGLELKINDRKILHGMLEIAGVPDDQGPAVLTVLDKLDKVGRDKVEELTREIIDGEAATSLFAFVDDMAAHAPTDQDGVLAVLAERLAASKRGIEGVRELEEVFEHLDVLGVPRKFLRLDTTLSRGLDYYTGPIYEFTITGLGKFGSLGGGGRYDDLMSLYGMDVPATGVCIGLSRVQSALERLDLIEKAKTPTRALVLALPDSTMADRLTLVQHMRQGGVPAEVYYEEGRFKKQIVYAERRGIPYVVIQGPSEKERGVVQLKDIRKGEQTEVALDDLCAAIQVDE